MPEIMTGATPEQQRLIEQRQAEEAAHKARLLKALMAKLERCSPAGRELALFDFEHGWNDLFYFGRRILGYSLDHKPHREMCGFVSSTLSLYKLLLAPRGSFKTSVMSQANPVWRIIKNPNIRILLDSVSMDNSENNNKVVENHLARNERLRFLYGDHSGKKLKWNDHEFVSNMRTNFRLKEPTVCAASQGKIQIGPHYDLIIPDDEHDKENYKTPEAVAKVKEHLRLLFGLLDPGGEMMIGGHRWGYTDAYSMVMGDTDDPEELKFAERFRNGIMVRAAEDDNGNLYFPRVMHREELRLRRDLLGSDLYNAQYMNEPIMAGDNAAFEARYFKRYKELPEETKLNLTVDPGGEKRKSDHWCFFLGGIDSKAIKYFIRYINTPASVTIAAEILYQFVCRLENASLADARKRADNPDAEPIKTEKPEDGKPRRKIDKIGFEVTGQQGSILTSIKEYIWNKYQLALDIKPLAHAGEDKETRVYALGPEYKLGKIYHSEQMSEPYGLEDQLQKFPKGKKDIADAAAMQREVAKAPKVKIEARPPANMDEMIAEHLRERAAGRNTIQRVHPVMGSDF